MANEEQTGGLDQLVQGVAELLSAADDFDKITQLELLQHLQNATAGAIARVSADFEVSQRDEQRRQQVPSRERGRGIADQIALARRISPAQASRDLGFARAMRRDLAGTGRLLSTGQINERVAQAVHRETDHLEPTLRRQVDGELVGALPRLGVRAAANAARRAALAADPDGATKRATKAAADRAVWFKPQPDGMCKIVAFLPAPEGIAAFGALKKDTAAAMTTGAIDGRTRPQAMADLFVERLTGRPREAGLPVEVQLVMGTDQLFGDTPDTAGSPSPAGQSDPDGPAWLDGYGPIPAAMARAIIAGHPALFGPTPVEADHAQAWVRCVLTDPVTGQVTAVDPRRRRFDGTVRRFIRIRDQLCRTPFCEAPIDDADHVHRFADGGPTNIDNGAGVCRRFNLVKEMPGWSVRVLHGPPEEGVDGADGTDPPPGHGHTIEITTPTGKTYRSTAPPAPCAATSPTGDDPTSVVEAFLTQRLDLRWAA